MCCTIVSLHYLIRFPLAKGVNLYLSVCRLLLCARSVMIVNVSIGGTKQIAHDFQGIASSWLVMCTFSFCLSGFFSPLLCYMQVLRLGVQLSLSMISL